MVERYIPRSKITARLPNWQRAVEGSLVTSKRRTINPFEVSATLHPAQVLPPEPARMAMDQTINFSTQWAGAAITASWGEGLQFLGYPYLAELAQRPEYRVISQTIAEEMTRKWLKFEATSQPDEEDTEEELDEPNEEAGELSFNAAFPKPPNGVLPKNRMLRGKKFGENGISPEGDDKTDKIKELEEFFKEMNVRECLKTIVEQDGFFGRSHLYLDTGDTDNREELRLPIGNGSDAMSRMKVKRKKPLIRIKPVEAVWCYPTNYESTDPLKPSWYRPEHWFVMGKEIHISRLLTFVGNEVPDLLKPAYSFGGLSMSQMAKPYIDNWLQTRQSVNDLIQAFVVWGLKTNLAETLQVGGDQLFARLELFNRLRNNRGVMAIDKDTEEFFNVTASLSGLEALQAQSQEHMAAVSRIPLVKLLGIQPTGLNASSEGEIRVFYDTIHGRQESFLTRAVRTIMHFAMLSLWGKIDEDIDFHWNPLWALDETQAAQVELTRAQTAQIWVEMGVIDKMEERKRIADAPETMYPGIDPDEEPEPPEPPPGEGGEEGDPMGMGGIPGLEEPEDAPESPAGGPNGAGGGHPTGHKPKLAARPPKTSGAPKPKTTPPPAKPRKPKMDEAPKPEPEVKPDPEPALKGLDDGSAPAS